jgi:hypothetical protein
VCGGAWDWARHDYGSGCLLRSPSKKRFRRNFEPREPGVRIAPDRVRFSQKGSIVKNRSANSAIDDEVLPGRRLGMHGIVAEKHLHENAAGGRRAQTDGRAL